jgi:hypothetical protein
MPRFFKDFASSSNLPHRLGVLFLGQGERDGETVLAGVEKGDES